MSTFKNRSKYFLATLMLGLISGFALAEEYCPDDGPFTISCGQGEVIKITSAIYGYQVTSKCFQKDPLPLPNCVNDITSALSIKCSGHRSCHIAHMAQAFTTIGNTKSCSSSLAKALNESHYCMSVLSHCRRDVPTKLNLTAQPTGYLSSSYMMPSSAPSSCEWLLEAQKGQHIRLSVEDFSDVPDKVADNYRCWTYAELQDDYASMTPKQMLTSCNRNIDNVLSKSHQLSLKMLYLNRSDGGQYLLKYEAVGCVWPSPPQGAHIEEVNETTIAVRCIQSKEIWLLSCNGSAWNGPVGSCSDYLAKIPEKTDVVKPASLSYGVSIIVIVSIAVILCLIILLVGFIFIKRSVYYKESDYIMEYKNFAQRQAPDILNNHEVGHCHIPLCPSDSQRPLLMRQETIQSTESSDYAHIWDIQRPVPVSPPCVPDYDLGNGTMSTMFASFRPRAEHHIYEAACSARDAHHPYPSYQPSTERPFYYELDPSAVPERTLVGDVAPAYPRMGVGDPRWQHGPMTDAMRFATVRSSKCTCIHGNQGQQQHYWTSGRKAPLRRLHSFTDVELRRKDSIDEEQPEDLDDKAPECS